MCAYQYFGKPPRHSCRKWRCIRVNSKLAAAGQRLMTAPMEGQSTLIC